MARNGGGQVPGMVLIADLQTAGRGRLDRTWVAPEGTAFTGSMSCASPVPPELLGLVPVAAGLAVLDALSALGVPSGLAKLKWPNDVIVPQLGDRKLSGVLCEAGNGRIVIGIGLNRQRPADVDGVLAERAAWISDLLAPGAGVPDMVDVAVELVTAVATRLEALAARPPAVVADQRAACDTIGRAVKVDLGDRSWTGTAVDVDERGQLLVVPDGASEPVTVLAGDVVHLRPLPRT